MAGTLVALVVQVLVLNHTFPAYTLAVEMLLDEEKIHANSWGFENPGVLTVELDAYFCAAARLGNMYTMHKREINELNM